MKNTVFQFLTILNHIIFYPKTVEDKLKYNIYMLKIIFATLIIVAICIALLCVKILFKRNGRFPNTHVSGSKAMRERGIGCVQSQDREQRKINPHAISERSKE